jgi:hypothetical protein
MCMGRLCPEMVTVVGLALLPFGCRLSLERENTLNKVR